MKRKPIDRLVRAAEQCAIARGTVEWTNGYRARAERTGLPADDADRLHTKEMEQWARVAVADRAFRRIALRVLREARR